MESNLVGCKFAGTSLTRRIFYLDMLHVHIKLKVQQTAKRSFAERVELTGALQAN